MYSSTRILFKLMVSILIVLGIFDNTGSQSVHAQGPVACAPDQVIAALVALKPSPDKATNMSTLAAISKAISAQTVACNGFTFTGKGGALVDPFDIPAGSYKASLVTTGSMNVIISNLAGGNSKPCLAILADSRLQTRLDARSGCRATIEVTTFSDNQLPWTVTLEPLQ